MASTHPPFSRDACTPLPTGGDGGLSRAPVAPGISTPILQVEGVLIVGRVIDKYSYQHFKSASFLRFVRGHAETKEVG